MTTRASYGPSVRHDWFIYRGQECAIYGDNHGLYWHVNGISGRFPKLTGYSHGCVVGAAGEMLRRSIDKRIAEGWMLEKGVSP